MKLPSLVAFKIKDWGWEGVWIWSALLLRGNKGVDCIHKFTCCLLGASYSQALCRRLSCRSEQTRQNRQ